MEITVVVQNLKCGGCGKTITSRLSKVPGISEIVVTPESSEVAFTYASANNLAEAERTLLTLGYPPEGVNNNMSSKAKSFVSCATGKLK